MTVRRLVLPVLESTGLWTGERFVPGLVGEIELEHFHRYIFAASLCKDKRVLDLACGEGYGTYVLAQVASSAVGADIDPDTIRHASNRYKAPNLNFLIGTCTAIPLPANSVDCVVSFETLEHIGEHEGFLLEIKRVLREGGLLMMSTPDKSVYNGLRTDSNPFHVRELEKDEFAALVERHFHCVAFASQKAFFGSLIAPDSGPSTPGLSIAQQDEHRQVALGERLFEAPYVVAVCSDSALPPLPCGLFEGTLRAGILDALKGGIAERDGEIVAARVREGEIGRRLAELEAVVRERDKSLLESNETLSSARSELAALKDRAEAVIRERDESLLESNETLSRARSELAALKVRAAGVTRLARRLRRANQRLRNRLERRTARLQQRAVENDRLARELERARALDQERMAALDRLSRSLERTLQDSRSWRLAGVLRRLRSLGGVESRGKQESTPGATTPAQREGPWRRLAGGWRRFRDERTIRRGWLFDARYYLSSNPDVAQARVDPIRHYVAHGAAEGRAPHALFDSIHYLRLYPDIAAHRLNPLAHYLRSGADEGRSPNPWGLPINALEVWRSLQASRIPSSLGDAAAALEFLSPSEPLVSIIIPVFNQLPATLRCLKSLAGLGRSDVEILVIDDRSTDQTPELLAVIPGLRYLRNDENVGFLRSCNRAAAEAHGQYLVLLNNDTVPLPGWLDALLSTFTFFPKAGLVGSMLLYPDGRLQEAGGLIWADGSGWNVGRLDCADKPEYGYVREVDYCSGASMMVPASLWRELGGFDETFAPAYYEDADFAFRVRSTGRGVYYQPFSRVVHVEGLSSGKSVDKGVKSHQALNHPKFAAQWADALSDRGDSALPSPGFRDHLARKQVLVVDSSTPRPDHDAGSLDTYEYLRFFKDLAYHVTFIPQSNLLHDGKYTEQLRRLGVECLYVPFIRSISDYLAAEGSRFDLVVLFRLPVAAALIDSIREYAPRARVIFATVDLHFLREERESHLRGDAEAAARAMETRRLELACMEKADYSILWSEHELEVIREAAPHIPVGVVREGRPIPGRAKAFAERRDVLFLGGFGHPPNVDAVVHFVRKIWPGVRRALPGIRFIIAGSNTPPLVRRLASKDVVVRGFVPDLGELMDSCRLTVAPLRFGAGVKGKVVSSLSYGVPVVGYPLAFEGMGLQPGDGIVVADKPEEVVEALARVYSTESQWMALSEGGLAAARRLFSIDAFRSQVAAALEASGSLPV